MMQAEKVAEDLRATHDSVTGPQSPVTSLATAVRRLERRAAQAPALIEPAVKAIDAALTALAGTAARRFARARVPVMAARRLPVMAPPAPYSR